MTDMERVTIEIVAAGPVQATDGAKMHARAAGWTIKTLVSCREKAGSRGTYVVVLACRKATA